MLLLELFRRLKQGHLYEQNCLIFQSSGFKYRHYLKNHLGQEGYDYVTINV